jgi:haloalkane dehalogenase
MLVVQRLGSLLGLKLPLAMPDRFRRLLVMNTSIATGQIPTKGFIDWRAYSNRNPDMKVAALMQHSCCNITQAEADAYSAPFPDARYKGGVCRFPNLVMKDPEMDGVDVSKASLDLYGTSDGVQSGGRVHGVRNPASGAGTSVMKNLLKV